MGAHDSDAYPTFFENRVIVGHNILMLDGLVEDVRQLLERIQHVIKTGRPCSANVVYMLPNKRKKRFCRFSRYDDMHALCVMYAIKESIQRGEKCNAQNAVYKIPTTPLSVRNAA